MPWPQRFANPLPKRSIIVSAKNNAPRISPEVSLRYTSGSLIFINFIQNIFVDFSCDKMTHFSPDKTNETMLRRMALPCRAFAFCLLVVPIFCVVFAVSAGMVFAELPSSEIPKRNRVVTYEPARVDRNRVPVKVAANETQREQTPARRNREMAYQPAGSQADATAYSVARPIADPQLSSDDRSSRRAADALLSQPLNEPGGIITDPDARKMLTQLQLKSEAAKNGTAIQPDSNSGSNGNTSTPSTGDNTIIAPESTVGMIIADDIFQRPGTTDWYAMKGNEPFPVIKHRDKFYKPDEQGIPRQEVIVFNENTDAAAANNNAGQGETGNATGSDKMRNAMLLVVTVVAVLAALSVGFLAFDYKYRWEQEIVNQNNRLLGNGGTGSTFPDSDAFEPETFRFSSDDYGSLDSTSDHSFRTIA